MKDRRSLTGVLLVVALAFLVVVPCGTHFAPAQVAAQAQFNNGQTSGLDNVFLPAPRNLRQMLNAADEAIEDERYSEAATLLGSVLSRSGSEDYFIDPSHVGDDLENPTEASGGSTQVSLKTEALRLLGRMPAAGLRSYELQFGAEAQVLLEEAVDAGEIEKLIEVTRRFPLTRAGDTAMILLGQYYLDHGQPLAGALCFEKASRSSETLQQNDPQLSLTLAICWRRAGYAEKALEVLANLQARQPNIVVSVGDEEHRMFANPAEGLNWLDNLLGGPPANDEAAAPQREWRMYRGNPSRNGLATGGPPLGSFRWRLPLTTSRGDEDILLDLYTQFEENGQVALPALHALAVQDVILVRDPEQLWAIDFDTGKRLWSYPWEPSEASSGASGAGTQRVVNSPRMQELYQRMWEDSAYGQISSDGDSVFLVDDLGYSGASGRYPQVQVLPGGLQQLNPNLPKTYNQLVALDIERQGAIRWVVGGAPRPGEDNEDLSGVFFLGPPLSVMGKLYAMVEVNGEIRLVVLSARTGELEWSQQLAHVETNTILNDSLRRLAGASPSFADGVLVCPTTTGAVVAVDVANRALLWGFQYERSIDILRQQQIFRAGAANLAQGFMANTWNDATVAIDQGRVIVTPMDGDQLYALDLVTGEVLWEPRARDGLGFLACIHDGHAIVGGNRKMISLDMTTGEIAWEHRFDEGVRPSGRGLLCSDTYLLPTTQSKMLTIGLEDGTVAETIETPAALGNLIAYRGEIISVGSVSTGDSRYRVTIDSLRQVEPLRDDVSRRLEQQPEDVWALARQGELLQYDGQPHAALETFQQAYTIAVRDSANADPLSLEAAAVEETRRLLVGMLLEQLEQDFTANRDLAIRMSDVIDDPLQQRHFLRLMAAGSCDTGRPEEAFEYFIHLIELEESVPAWVNAGSEHSDTMVLEDHLRLSADQWVAQQVHSLMAEAEPAQAEKMQAAIGSKLTEIAAVSSLNRRLRWASIFREHQFAQEMHLTLAEELLNNGNALRAELILGELAENEQAELAAPATLLLARINQEAGYARAAALQYHRLQTEWPEHVFGDRTAREIVESVDPGSDVGICLHTSGWPQGHVYAADELSRRSRSLGSQPYYPVEVLRTSGPAPAGLSFVFDQQTYTLFVRDWRGEELRTIPLNVPQGAQYPVNFNFLTCELHGHLLVLSLGMEILAIDLLAQPLAESQPILWRFDLGSLYGAGVTARAIPQSRVYQNPWVGQVIRPVDMNDRLIGQLGPLSARSIFFQRGLELLCVDPLTGETVWSRRDIEPGSSLFGDEEFLVVASPTRSAGRLLRASDGAEMGIRDVRNLQQRWHTHGRRFLTWDSSGEEVTLRMFDPWTEEDVWSYTAARDSRGCIVEDRWVAVLQPNGDFAMLSLETGAPLIEQHLETEERLRSINVIPSSNQFLLLTHRNYQTAAANLRVDQAPRGLHAQLMNGLIYAFDRESGEPLWQSPARVDQYSVPLDQASELPVLLLMRFVTRVQRSERQSSSEIVIIDKRDGRVVYSEERIPAQIVKYELTSDPENGTITLRLPNKSIILEMTDDPTPPAPPLQTGDTASEQPGE